MGLKALAEAALQQCLPRTLPAQSSVDSAAHCNPENGHPRTLPTDAANEDESEESKSFWSNLIDRINWCDLLIHELCDIRGDSQARRDDLIRTRQRTAPVNIDGDIRYLLEEIERVAPTSTPDSIRDCRDCEHQRGRNNNAIRYCVSPDSAVQRDDALASAIVDCRVATRCNAFRSTAR